MNIRSALRGLPFSLISSQGFGNSHSSSTSIGSFHPAKSLGSAHIQTVINLANGNVCVRDVSLSFPDIHSFIEINYFYNNLAHQDNAWHLAVGRQFKSITKNAITVIEADGHEVEYIFNAEKNCYEAASFQDGRPIIRIQDAVYILYHPDTQITEQFDAEGKLLLRKDEFGNATQFEYHTDGKIKSILSPGGIHYSFQYEDGKISLYRDHVLVHTYMLNADGCLMKSVTHDGYEIQYTYDDNHQLKQISQSDTSQLGFEYFNDDENKNKIQTIQVGDDPANTHHFFYTDHQTTFLECSGRESILKFDEKLQPQFYKTGDEIRQYEWNAHRQITKIIYTDNTEEVFQYADETGLLQKHIQRDGRSIVYQYSNEEKPLLMAKLNLAKDDLKAYAITHYVYDENRFLRYEISPEGRVKSFIPNKNGLVIEEREYLQDIFFTTSDKFPSLNHVRDWEKQLQAPRIVSKHFEYKNGQVKSIAQADGKILLAHDSRGNRLYKKTQYSENDYTELTQSFDDLNRITTKTLGHPPALTQETRVKYQAHIVSTQFSGNEQHTETLHLNTQGLPFKKIESVYEDGKVNVRETQYQYHALSRVKITTHPDQQKSLEFYDEHQRLAASVSVSGAVTTYQYDAKYRYEIKTAYAKKINHADLLDSSGLPNRDLLNALLIKNILFDEDRSTHTFYTVHDLPHYQIDERGCLTEYRYHANGKLAHTIIYEDKINQDELALLKLGQALQRMPNRLSARITSQFYDADELLIAKQDGAGYITEYVRNAGGLVSEKISYQTPNLLFSHEFNILKPTLESSQNTKDYYFYNEKKECLLEVDTEGYITQHEYFLDGKTESSIRFANKVEPAWYSHTHEWPKLHYHESNDHIIQYEYDELRRLIKERHSSGLMITYTYDIHNQQIACYHRDQDHLASHLSDHVRGTESQFNGWGEEIASTNARATQHLLQIDKLALSEIEKLVLKKTIWEKEATKSFYNEVGLKTKLLDANQQPTWYYYDQDQRPVCEIDASGAIILHQYNTFGEVIEEKKYYQRLSKEILSQLTGGYFTAEIEKLCLSHKKDVVTTYQRDQRGQIISKTDANGNVSQFEYNAFKQCHREYLSTNDKTPDLEIKHQYEARGLETKTIQRAVNLPEIVTEKKHDHCLGMVTDEIDACGGHTHYERDSLGNIIEIKKHVAADEYVSTAKNTYDAFSHLTQTVNADSEIIFTSYDYDKRMTTTCHEADGSLIITQANIFDETMSISELHRETSEILLHESFFHAPDGKLTQHINADNISVTHTQDLMGHEIETINEDGIKTTYERNAVYQLTATIVDNKEHGLKLKTIYEPNAFGQAEIMMDARGVVTHQIFDGVGNEVHRIKDAGSEPHLNLAESISYNAQGKMTSQIQGDLAHPNQYHEQKNWDAYQRLQTIIIDPQSINHPHALQIETHFAYDALNQLIKETDALGNVTRQYFDLLKRKRFKLTPLNEHQSSVMAWDYTPGGKLKSLRTFYLPVENSSVTDETSLADLSALVKSHVDDTLTLFFYDEKGREQYVIRLIYSHDKKQYQGLVEEKCYNTQDLEIKTIHYAHAMDATDFETWNTTFIDIKFKEAYSQQLDFWQGASERVEGVYTEYMTDDEQACNTAKNSSAKSIEDRVQYHWYNKTKQRCLTIDQDGRVHETRRDCNERVIAEIQYGKQM